MGKEERERRGEVNGNKKRRWVSREERGEVRGDERRGGWQGEERGVEKRELMRR